VLSKDITDRLWVDSKKQVIVHAEVFGEAQDHHLIPPVLDGAKENMEAIGCGEEYFTGRPSRQIAIITTQRT